MTSLDTFADAREQFLALVREIRPELHRYCARLTGSVIEGEDIVQDTLAKGFYALSLSAELPAQLRPWLFRIAHNCAIDFLRRHERKLADPTPTAELDLLAAAEPPDPAIVRAALARFAVLPLTQRSAVILKDVLGHSLEDVAATMDTTVLAVKSALIRGRARLRELGDVPVPTSPRSRADLDRYAAAFNARDWDGVRALIAEDCHLDLVGKSHRRGKAVGAYFVRYERESLRVAPGLLEGRPALGVFPGGATAPAYFILLEWLDGRVVAIRDFRYTPYITDDADWIALTSGA